MRASDLPLEERVGQLLMASLDGAALDAEALRFLDACHIGNVIHFGNNVQARDQATELNAALRAHITRRCGVAPLIGIDHEGGRVMRFARDVTHFPSAMAVSATGDAALAEAVGNAMGRELAAMGFDISFAPVLDVNTNPENPVIGLRAYGDDPQAVACYGVAMARGLQAGGVMACGKHFPGHGDTAVDSHFGLPRVGKTLAQLEREELVPFAAAIDAGIDAIMTSHILYPAIEPDNLPATMSARILRGLLRQRMGFDGLIITDAMHMKAIVDAYGLEWGCVEAIRAGADLICIGTGGAGYLESQAACYRAILKAVQTGSLSEAILDEAVNRVLAAKERVQGKAAHAPDWAADNALAQTVAQASIMHTGGRLYPLGERVLCMAALAPAQRYGVAEADAARRSFATYAADLLGAAYREINGGEAPVTPQEADTLVLWMQQGNAAELRCMDDALGRGVRVIVVLTGLPYLAAKLPAACPVLCTWGTVDASIRAACDVLRRKRPALGKPPVRLE